MALRLGNPITGLLRPTFHVKRIIDDSFNAVIPHAKVHFVGDNIDQTVSVDDKGFYQIDIPVGTYTMTAW
jgi:hypothetical protein